ncbi:hypothetical protein BsWGS_08595 [Bradybaena similaris]
MATLRFASKVFKPFLFSFCPRVQSMTCRAISTGKDLVKFGNVQGTTGAAPPPDQGEEVLDVFQGKWVHDHTMLTSPEGEVSGPVFHGTSYYDLFEKPTIFYERNGRTWKVRTGLETKGYSVFYTFKLGKDFLMQYPDNGLYKVIVFQDGEYMKWAFQPYIYQHGDFPKMENIIFHVTEVKDGKLVWKTEYPDNSITVKTYNRSTTP